MPCISVRTKCFRPSQATWSPNFLLKRTSRLAKFGYIFSNPEAEICFKCAVGPGAEIGVDECVDRGEDVLEGQSSSQHSMLIYHRKEQFRQRAGEEHMLDL
jgi:hypothetical protein